MSVANKVLVALILGVIFGLVLNISDLVNAVWVDKYFINGAFHVVGKLFVNALKMLVVPLVLFSLIPGIIGIGDISLLGRIGTKAVALYLATTAIAITTAITFAVSFGIGEGMNIESPTAFAGKQAAAFSDVLIGIVPTNPIAAMANGDMLAIIFFAIFFGIAMLSIAKESKELVALIEQINSVIMHMVTMVMYFAPIAVFCLVTKAIAQLGIELLGQLAGYVLVLLATLIFHVLVTQMIFLKTFTGLSIRLFLEKIRTAQLFAFSTSSSGATIPITLQTVQNRIGVDRSVSSFCVPFGATINMDGTAMMQGVATVFIANIYGIDLGLSEYLLVIITAVLASIGTAAVPSVGLVMLTMVFSQVGLPVEGIAIILGVDRLLDMVRTAVNVSGDAVVTTIVAKSENCIDLDIFNDPKAGLIEEPLKVSES
jgi:Na+/H+-dicarboxylate symporter